MSSDESKTMKGQHKVEMRRHGWLVNGPDWHREMFKRSGSPSASSSRPPVADARAYTSTTLIVPLFARFLPSCTS